MPHTNLSKFFSEIFAAKYPSISHDKNFQTYMETCNQKFSHDQNLVEGRTVDIQVDTHELHGKYIKRSCDVLKPKRTYCGCLIYVECPLGKVADV